MIFFFSFDLRAFFLTRESDGKKKLPYLSWYVGFTLMQEFMLMELSTFWVLWVGAWVCRAVRSFVRFDWMVTSFFIGTGFGSVP